MTEQQSDELQAALLQIEALRGEIASMDPQMVEYVWDELARTQRRLDEVSQERDAALLQLAKIIGE